MTIYSLNTLISAFTEVPTQLTTIVSVAGFPQQFTLTIASIGSATVSPAAAVTDDDAPGTATPFS